MKNFAICYKKKYHYILKYLLLALPILITLIFNWNIPDNTNYTGAFESFIQFNSKMLNLPLNNWYVSLCSSLFGNDGLTTLISNPYGNVILNYPLWVMYVYVFDLVVDVFTLIPKVAHRFIEKLTLKD